MIKEVAYRAKGESVVSVSSTGAPRVVGYSIAAGVVPSARRRHGSAEGLIAVLVVSGFFALLTVGYQLSWVIAQSEGTPAAFVSGLALSIVLALTPLPVMFAAVVALDRQRPRPWIRLAFVFGWGAGIAAFFSVALESWVSADLQLYFGVDATTAETVSGVMLAPPVEEAFKGAALVGLLCQCRRAIGSLTDGVVYASVAGLGFATMENILYYLIPIVREGAEEGLAFAAVRGPMMLFMHPLWTSLFGLGASYALMSRGRVRWPALSLGYAGAALLHFLWNHTIDTAPAPSGVVAWLAGMGKVYLLELVVVGALIGVTVRERRRRAAATWSGPG
ncbi:PrsW family intramembrane metalloprotease [Nonomuraea africana]|uniref:RsiW-degrading membrane proteinase PrsW (M82 family) n=1 Tax=Nonomuraea africana TaxID=46171 RepID=A0ABR9KVI6_9ACTN|nr:PrsW family intramembrane metalloprotease [Nonomuraea africana]MBE1566044.1 RsiW-degrading membrane proteinase PrsW (M82 family) [Nonomuraea africana]